MSRQAPGVPEEGVINKVLYGEATSRGPTPLYTIFDIIGIPFVYLFIEKWYPFHTPSLTRKCSRLFHSYKIIL